MAQPDIPRMVQGGTTFIEQLALCQNIPAIDGGGAILTRLDQLPTRLDQLSTRIDQLSTSTADVRDEIVALRLEATIRSVFSSFL